MEKTSETAEKTSETAEKTSENILTNLLDYIEEKQDITENTLREKTALQEPSYYFDIMGALEKDEQNLGKQGIQTEVSNLLVSSMDSSDTELKLNETNSFPNIGNEESYLDL